MRQQTKERQIIATACERAGGMRALARAIGIHYQNIQGWKRIPAERMIAIETATGIPREQLRPDLFVPRRAKV
jgi:DNA-binding transcriptional regulator YdaS (Cro superfamily)